MMSNSANRNAQKFGRDAIQRRLRGIVEPGGMVGTLSRGKTVYGTGSYAAHSGGGSQYGRPAGSKDESPYMSAIHRRLGQRNRMTPSKFGSRSASGR